MYRHQTATFISLPELWCISVELLVSFRLQSCEIGYCHRIVHFATRAAKYCHETAGFISLPELWCISIELLVSFRLQSCDIGYCHRIAGFIKSPELRCTAIELLVSFLLQNCDALPSSWFFSPPELLRFAMKFHSASRTDELCFRVLYTVIWLLVSFFLGSSVLIREEGK